MVASFPEGDFSLTTRSPGYVWVMPRSILRLSMVPLSVILIVEVVVWKSLIGALGVTVLSMVPVGAGGGVGVGVTGLPVIARLQLFRVPTSCAAWSATVSVHCPLLFVPLKSARLSLPYPTFS